VLNEGQRQRQRDVSETGHASTIRGELWPNRGQLRCRWLEAGNIEEHGIIQESGGETRATELMIYN
jgi:hypothetical protein